MKKLLLLIIIGLTLSACGSKQKSPTVTPTPPKAVYEIPQEKRPYISLTPSTDGRWLTLKISKIPSNIKGLEYEVLYNAIDGNNEIEKGAGGTIDQSDISSSIEKKILLGTESCTNGCKYKYDENVYGGNVTINFFNNDNQIATYQSPFSLSSAQKITKNSTISLPDNSKTIAVNGKHKGFFVLLRSYTGGYSVFSSDPSPIAKDYPVE